MSGMSESRPTSSKRGKTHHPPEEFSSSSNPNHQGSDPLPVLIPNFLNELVTEILSRLPAKSLARFTCVSKPWLSLISSPQFIKSHLAIASASADCRHHALICNVDPENGDCYYELHSVSSILYAPEAETLNPEAIDIGHPMVCPSPSIAVVGSCNGLVCIFEEVEKELFLWNPCTKKSKRLPQPFTDKERGCCETFGFGYDKVKDDYKVLGLFRVSSEPVSRIHGCTKFDTEIKVFSLKKDSWSEMEAFHFEILKLDWGDNYLQHANGRLHWQIDSSKIGSLDLVNESYAKIDCPSYDDSNIHGFELGVLGDSLSLFLDYDTTHAEVWMMKEDGDRKDECSWSWIKVISIPYIDPPDEALSFGRSHSVCLMGNGEILFVLRSVLVLYNPKTNTFRRFPQIGPLENVTAYVESLVSPCG